MGQDEYNLANLVNLLGDFDPVEIIGDSVDGPVSIDCICPEYQEDEPNVKVKGRLKLNIGFWEHIGASRFIRGTILEGYKIPFIYTPAPAQLSNNRSAIQNSDFVDQAISDLLASGSVVECMCAPTVVNPLSVSIQSNGKKRLILDLRYPNYYVKSPRLNLKTLKPCFFLLSIVPRTGFIHLISNLVTTTLTFSRQIKSF